LAQGSGQVLSGCHEELKVMKVGFIGLGNMGSGVAANLFKAGHALTVYNRTPTKTEALVAKGATFAKTPGEAARGDVVITMLADDAAVEGVVFGTDGVLAGLRTGSIHISMSTISVSLAERLAGAHQAAGPTLRGGAGVRPPRSCGLRQAFHRGRWRAENRARVPAIVRGPWSAHLRHRR